MTNKYRYDEDLEILRYADNKALEFIVTYLTKDENGNTRLTEELLDNENFKKSNGDFRKVWKEIAAELQYFGGDTFANILRGSGVLYREILTDVCKKIDVRFYDSQKTIDIEQNLLSKLFEKAWSEMSSREKEDIKNRLGIDPTLKGSMLLGSILASISSGIISREVSLLLARAVAQAIVGTSVSTAVEVGATRLLGIFTGPIGWAIVGLLTVPSISGPAFRVTLPCVIQIAAIRQQISKKKSHNYNNTKNINNPKIGDHLVTPRKTYTHHGIYIGGGKVIHYSGLADSLSAGPIEETTLESFSGKHGFTIKKHASPVFTGEAVVKRAQSRLGENEYKLHSNNCEHFCEWCINDNHFSEQVEHAKSTTKTSIAGYSFLRLIAPPPVAAAASIGYGAYNWIQKNKKP